MFGETSTIATIDPTKTAAGSGRLQTGSEAGGEFVATPLPQSWILEGEPVARSLPLTQSADGHFTSGLWECTDGKFDFTYRCDEIIRLLEGAVTIELDGAQRTLGPGDVAYFPQGATARWTVHGYVKKFAIFSVRPRGLLRRVLGKLRKLIRPGK